MEIEKAGQMKDVLLHEKLFTFVTKLRSKRGDYVCKECGRFAGFWRNVKHKKDCSVPKKLEENK
jgi:hypothetical protein